MDRRWEAQTALLAEPLNPKWILEERETQAEWQSLQSKLEHLQWGAAQQLTKMLENGDLVARGVPVEGGVAQAECEVPKAFWRFLMLDWANDTAAYENRRYVGVRLSRASSASRN